jgi:acyl carrier protein
MCQDYERYKDLAQQYFKTEDDLHQIVAQAKAGRQGKYDCMTLLSGGKDSTYILGQLVEMGLTPLVFSLDNGYISEDAKANIRRVVDNFGLDLVFGSTPAMPAIFADSLRRHSNVCQGCFKTIYTLSMNLARKHGIKYIFTGLSRGQLYETRLYEMFRNRIFDVQQMDQAVLDARKVYHRLDDEVARSLDVEIFKDDRIFEEIQFIDFYRYIDVGLDEVYRYLDERLGWVRPADTGRSTNCLINDAGIYVHQRERGYHNYALPYSWDVRMGHKTREAALEELDDDIDVASVRRILDEVGYEMKEGQSERTEKRLAAYYVSDQRFTLPELRAYLARELPDYMMPAYFVALDEIPLTQNGKVDRRALPGPEENRPELETTFVVPQTVTQSKLAGIWAQTLNVKRVGIHDDFFELGGASVPAVQVMARIAQTFQVELPLRAIFETPTIAQLSQTIEQLIIAEIENLSDEEAEQLLANLA